MVSLVIFPRHYIMSWALRRPYFISPPLHHHHHCHHLSAGHWISPPPTLPFLPLPLSLLTTSRSFSPAWLWGGYGVSLASLSGDSERDPDARLMIYIPQGVYARKADFFSVLFWSFHLPFLLSSSWWWDVLWLSQYPGYEEWLWCELRPLFWCWVFCIHTFAECTPSCTSLWRWLNVDVRCIWWILFPNIFSYNIFIFLWVLIVC